MVNVGLLPVCFLFGLLLRRSGRIPENTSSVLNAFIIHVSLPAVTLLHIHNLQLDKSLLYPMAMPWAVFAVGVVFFLVVGRIARWSPQTIGGLILTGALANTSFMGLPMIDAYFGNANGELGLAIIIDQLGTYMVLSTLGIMIAVICSSEGKVSFFGTIWKIVSFPPFLALVLALLLRPVAYPPAFETMLVHLGYTLTPLALISIGSQIRFADLRGKLGALTVGLGFKLLMVPALVMIVLTDVLATGGRFAQVTVFEAAMGPQIGGSIVALEHKLDRALVILMVGVGIPLSFATLPLWWYLLQGV
jgi:predicted permease